MGLRRTILIALAIAITICLAYSNYTTANLEKAGNNLPPASEGSESASASVKEKGDKNAKKKAVDAKGEKNSEKKGEKSVETKSEEKEKSSEKKGKDLKEKATEKSVEKKV